MYSNISMCAEWVRSQTVWKLLMNKLVWKSFLEHEEKWFLLFQPYPYENAIYVISCRNKTLLSYLLYLTTLIKSIQTAEVAALQLDFHPESHSHLIFFLFLTTWALYEKENMVFPATKKCQVVFSDMCASVCNV